jgi:hypothetical protein
MSGHDEKGSSGSDDGSSDTAAATTAATAATRTPAPNYAPGQLEAISAQLGTGYSQNPADILAYLQQLYPSPEQQAAEAAAQAAQTASTTSTSSDAKARTEANLETLLMAFLPAEEQAKVK